MAYCQTCKREKALFEMVETGSAEPRICVDCSTTIAKRDFLDPPVEPSPANVAESSARMAQAALRNWVWEFISELLKDAMLQSVQFARWPRGGRPLCSECAVVLALAGTSQSITRGMSYTWRTVLTTASGESECAVCQVPTAMRVQVRLTINDSPTAEPQVREGGEPSPPGPQVQEFAPIAFTHFFCLRCRDYLRMQGVVTFKATGQVMTLIGPSPVLSPPTAVCMACGRPAVSTLTVRLDAPEDH